jgi:hypothetical protein
MGNRICASLGVVDTSCDGLRLNLLARAMDPVRQHKDAGRRELEQDSYRRHSAQRLSVAGG